MRTAVIIEAPWREPIAALGAVAERPWALGLMTGAASGWSYVAAEPAATLTMTADDPRDPFTALAELAGPPLAQDPHGPPFQGGVAGLLGYELATRIEALPPARLNGWPDLACARYDAVLAFDHARGRAFAVGRAAAEPAARRRAEAALGWIAGPERTPEPLEVRLTPDDPDAYERAVAEVVARIGAGEIFQANIARRWRGSAPPDVDPFQLLARLVRSSPAPFASYLRLADRALVSNSPERFLQVTPMDGGLVAETQPIKGTAPRGRCAREDAEQAVALAASAKDRAENLMIVDLMRNDLARVCAPGTVTTPELFRLASFANVHHLVSTVRGRLAAGRSAIDLLRAAFPPGSITGAPKVQAMKVIAELEGPRGPFFGAMIRLATDGGLDSNVLIRTATFVREAAGWRIEARAGAGLVADSRPVAERIETETKISALMAAFAARPELGPR